MQGHLIIILMISSKYVYKISISRHSTTQNENIAYKITSLSRFGVSALNSVSTHNNYHTPVSEVLLRLPKNFAIT